MFIKICGLTKEEDFLTAVNAGANAVGFVFAKSPRKIYPEQAYSLCKNTRENIIRVAVMHHPSPEQWHEVKSVFDPDWLQTDWEDFKWLDLGKCKPLPVYRSGSVTKINKWPDRFIFEGRQSGTAELANWEEASEVAMNHRLILAGGLNSENVASAIQKVRPWGVDVSSGVEAERGTKDPDKIREFIAQVRATEQKCHK
tara:strand:- start:6695 stop:7291 length:597 start_codon:yes stop_codon:yes gene_type:complete